MNRPIPKLGSVKYPKQLSEQFFKKFTHIALPLISKDGDLQIDISKKEIKSLEEIFGISFVSEIKKNGAGITAKAGELIDIPVLDKEVKRVILVAVGNRSEIDMRKAATALGRKVKASKATLISFLAENGKAAQVHFLGTALATYSWSQKSAAKPDTPEINLLGDFAEVCERSAILLEATWKARDLIHTPSNVKSPSWMAEQAKKFAKKSTLSVKVKAGKDLVEFGGLCAVGNSSQKNPPRFVEVSYKPRGVKNPLHVVLVGKGITFDTGGVSLKRPYEMMVAMKTDMSGAAVVSAVTLAAAKLKLPVKVTALLMLAENTISATAQRPSDVIKHYGGTTVEVINTDAEGRLVLADGLAFADLHLDPDFLIDVATLTGAASLGLGKQYAAMYTRDSRLAKNLHELSLGAGDPLWHMPLIDDYAIALASDVADFNHTADKPKFGAGSVTAALFLEKFVGKRKWVHLDIAGPARSEVDAGEFVKGGTGFGVRTLTRWLATL
ncbi:MAG: hypothetical protein RLZZ486_780 [Actinomycetota bacterium]